MYSPSASATQSAAVSRPRAVLTRSLARSPPGGRWPESAAVGRTRSRSGGRSGTRTPAQWCRSSQQGQVRADPLARVSLLPRQLLSPSPFRLCRHYHYHHYYLHYCYHYCYYDLPRLGLPLPSRQRSLAARCACAPSVDVVTAAQTHSRTPTGRSEQCCRSRSRSRSRWHSLSTTLRALRSCSCSCSSPCPVRHVARARIQERGTSEMFDCTQRSY